jgi:hypothetical protein
MHVLALFRGDAVRSPVSILLLEHPFHVEASGMAGLMGVSYQMPDPAKSDRSVSRGLRLVREHFAAKLDSL